MGYYKREEVLRMMDEKLAPLPPAAPTPIAVCSIKGCHIYERKDLVELQGGAIACDTCAHLDPPDTGYPRRRR